MNTAKKIIGILKFLARWIGPVLILLGVVFWLHESGLALPVSFPLAFPFSASLPWLGVVITLITWWLIHKPKPRLLLGCAVAGLLLCGWQYWDQARNYREVSISFSNRGARLEGTLFLPRVASRVPGIVMVQGSGSAPRWVYKIGGADHFSRAGYAVLTYDKRGVGDSSGHYEADCNTCPDNLELLASDASAALSLLADRPEVDAQKVGYWGVSQAGWIVPKAALMNGHAAFMLLITAPATTVHQNMRYERFTGAPVTLPPDGPTAKEAEILAIRANQHFEFPDTDPATELRRLSIPGLWIMGDRDGMVPPYGTIGVVQHLMKLGKPYEYQIIPGAGHGIAVSGEPLRQYWQTVDSWLARITKH